MNTTLYIIGNGFDLHHQLKTSYESFSEYLLENHKDIAELLERYISFQDSEHCWWSAFEEYLAKLDSEEILQDHTYALPDYSSDDFRSRDTYVFPDIMRDYNHKLTSDLFSAFQDFILQVKFPFCANERKILINKEATFLTFNYTNTLERLYNVSSDKIIYIHNSAFDRSENLILGHGISPNMLIKMRTPEPPENLLPKEMEEWYEANSQDFSYEEGREILLRYFKYTYKPTKNIIVKHSNFFKSLKSVDTIYVLGHSISSVDIPYFEEIVKNIKVDTKWIVSFYNADEYNRHLETLSKLDVLRENITLIDIEDLQIANKQLKLEFENASSK